MCNFSCFIDLWEVVNSGGLTGVTSRSNQSVNVRNLSMAGGAEILINGHKMASTPSDNLVFYTTSGDLTSIDYPITGSLISGRSFKII
jgi:hypothetical protein